MSERPLASLLAAEILASDDPATRSFAPLAREYLKAFMVVSEPLAVICHAGGVGGSSPDRIVNGGIRESGEYAGVSAQ